MRHRSLSALLVLVPLISASQEQTNSPEASLWVNGRAGDGFSRASVAETIPGSTLEIQIAGTPLEPILLLAGDRREPGIPLPSGILGLRDFLPILDGFTPNPLAPFARTSPAGTFDLSIGFDVPWGEELSFQGAVGLGGGTGLVLSAPQRLRSAPARLLLTALTPTGFVRSIRATDVLGVSTVEVSRPDLIDPGNDLEYAFSPDGTKVAYEVQTRLYVTDAKGYTVSRTSLVTESLYNLGGFRSWAWSPTENKLLYYADDVTPGSAEPFLHDVAAGSSVRAGVNAALDWGPATWSPDGRRFFYRLILFNPARVELAIANADGSSVTIPTFNVPNPGVVGTEYVWSPRADRVAFGGGALFGQNLYIASVSGGTSTLVHLDAENMQWSPDGGRLAFLSPSRAPRQLYSVSLDGSDLRRHSLAFAPPAPGVRSYAWSPDSRQLLYVAEETTFLPQLFVADAGGSALGSAAFLAGTQDLVEGTPRWSPDSRRIAYIARSASFQEELRVVDRLGATTRVASDSLEDYSDIAWEPAGLPLFTFRASAPGDDLHLFDCRTWMAELLTPGPANTGRAHWAPGGRWLVYSFSGTSLIHDTLTGSTNEVQLDLAASVTADCWSPIAPGHLAPGPSGRGVLPLASPPFPRGSR